MRFSKLIPLAALILAAISIAPIARSQDSVFPAGLPQGQITNLNRVISGITSRTRITLTKPATKIQIYSSTGASNIFVDFNGAGTATAGAGGTTEVFGGGSETYVGAPIKYFDEISDGAVGTECIVAN